MVRQASRGEGCPSSSCCSRTVALSVQTSGNQLAISSIRVKSGLVGELRYVKARTVHVPVPGDPAPFVRPLGDRKARLPGPWRFGEGAVSHRQEQPVGRVGGG